MSHGGRGLTGNQDKQKSMIQAPGLEIALSIEMSYKELNKTHF